MTIKVLSVKQPHADDIIFGAKFCENRTWPMDKSGLVKRPSIDPGEWLYIHASGEWDGERVETDGEGLCSAIIGRCKVLDVIHVDDLDVLSCIPVGSDTIPAEVREKFNLESTDEQCREAVAKFRHILDYLDREKISEEQFNAYVSGPVCWLLTDRQSIRPIVGIKGKLGVWKHEIDPTEIVVTQRQFR